MKRVYLGLGSNIGDREQYIRAALNALGAHHVHVIRISPLYETEPQGFAEQDWFLNAVAEAETDLQPRELLARIHAVESALERRRSVLNGPRTIDIDILFYADTVIATPELTVPHPRYSERRFVLAPLAALAPGLRDPQTHRTVAEMLAGLRGQSVRLFRSVQIPDPQ